MALSPDSLATDLMFQATAAIDQKTLIAGLGGAEALETKQILDMDRVDPRGEMELSPSMPFRRRGEKRLLMLDDAYYPPRADPMAEPIVTADLRPAKEELIRMCEALPIRLGRLFALGSWGDAVLVARKAEDLRGICLLPWVLDPQVDIDGKRRATPMSQKEFEAKILAFEKRLEEMDETQILAQLDGVNFERRGELLIVDVLEADGTWDQRKSLAMEQQLAAVEQFSMIPGAPMAKSVIAEAPAAKRAATPTAPVEAAPPAPPKPEKGPALTVMQVDGKSVLVFSGDRFDLDVAAALGKRDWDAVIRRSDNLSGAVRDQIWRDGAGWIAPLEFLSEVFVEGKPLSRPEFEKTATVADGVKSLEVHFPRFGPVLLVDVAGKGRFVTTIEDAARAAALVK
ncbi:MAG TPA: hypothetical protein VGM88_23070 [Kofleriaceae bacterium]|jgi:hypothetical protein